MFRTGSIATEIKMNQRKVNSNWHDLLRLYSWMIIKEKYISLRD